MIRIPVIFENMKAWSSNKISISLMIGSLFLLLLFQLFWLKNVYEDEKEKLVKEADQMVTTAVTSIEDSIFREVILYPLKDKLPPSMNKSEFQNIGMKSGMIKIHIDKEASQFISKKHSKNGVSSSMEISISGNIQSADKKQITDSLAYHNQTIDSAAIALITNFPRFELIMAEVQKQQSPIALPANFEIIHWNDSVPTTGLLSSVHTHFDEEVKYGIHMPHYKQFIFQKILPQILFSIFLFSSMALSFFMVWKSLEKQQQLTALKNDFISNITHELKTPITTVGVALEALSNFNALQNPERTEEYLNISKHELSRLSILVDKVLKMSMFEKREPELKIEMIDMQSMVQEVLTSMKLQFEKASARVNFQSKGSSFLLEGDKIHLTSVVYNLIDNALKYSPATPEINLLLENTSDYLQLTVADKGIGISNTDQPKIFDKFFRVPQGNQHNVKGHGLGLSYVASVIKKHQGDIHVNSQINKGTSFIISLPNLHE